MYLSLMASMRSRTYSTSSLSPANSGLQQASLPSHAGQDHAGATLSRVLLMNRTVSISPKFGESMPMLHSAHLRVWCGAVGVA